MFEIIHNVRLIRLFIVDRPGLPFVNYTALATDQYYSSGSISANHWSVSCAFIPSRGEYVGLRGLTKFILQIANGYISDIDNLSNIAIYTQMISLSIRS
jgi:hypothetical protein